jgi:protein O-GlcNAc transferase
MRPPAEATSSELSRAVGGASIRSALISAVALHSAGATDAAVVRYLAILEHEPHCFDALHLLGVAELQRGNPQTALVWLNLALAEDSTPACHAHRGAALRELGRSAEALEALNRALELDPCHLAALSNRAAALLDQGDAAAALESADRALALAPGHPVALYNRMSSLRELGRWREALAACEQALSILPASVELLAHYSALLRKAGRTHEALQVCERALVLRGPDAALWANRGHLLSELGNHAAAAASYRRAYELDRTLPHLPGWRLHAQLRIADWEGLGELYGEIAAGIDAGRAVCEPFVAMLAPLPRYHLRRCAELHTQLLRGSPSSEPYLRVVPTDGRVRLGYFSADFYDHPTSQLVAGVIEHHDRSRFEVTAFSLGKPVKDAMNTRLRAGFDHFIDLNGCSDSEAARLARQLGIDIAIDLGGYTRECRSGIFLRRAAPLQVSWLGFPGTLGAPFIDYLIADGVVAPEAHASDYAEALVRLPHCYQPNDATRRIAERIPTRAELGLPDYAVVFCCFNNPAKIAPEVFAVWMRLLRRLPASVLWLLDENPAATAQLRRHAQSHGVDAERIIFAPRRPTAEHLARHQAADLFLDTWSYNAHTTASDALWSGLPLLTLQGETFGSRVAASLLRAVGLPELIVESVADYEALAFELATDGGRLTALRQRLGAQRSDHPLFDTPRFTRDLETAYVTVWKRHRAGLAPEAFDVIADSPG